MIKIDFNSLNTIACPVCEEKGFKLEAVRFDSGRIVKCSRCGHLYLNPPLPQEALDTIYAAPPHYKDAAFRDNVEAWFLDPQGPSQHTLRYFENNGLALSGKRLFEIGVGAGRFLAECRKRGAQVDGLDFSLHTVSTAKKFFDLEVRCCSVETAQEVPAGAYDYVCAFEVIEHVPKPKEFLSLVKRILKKDGLAVITTPNFEIFKKMHNDQFTYVPVQEHLHYFTEKTLRQSLGDDFEIIHLSSVLPYLYGDRQKSVFIHNKLVWALWLAVRRVPLFFRIKEWVFSSLNEVKEKIDSDSLNGASFFCVVRKK